MLNIITKLLNKRKSTCSAVIVAAGSASRMKGTDKVLYQLGTDPLIVHAIRAFETHERINKIVVVTRSDLISDIRQLCQDHAFHKVLDVIEGGGTRPESVMRGLDRLAEVSDYVAVHDGARPFVTKEIISNTIDKALEYHAAAPAVAVKDTIKVAVSHLVKQTPDRSDLFAVQTPQIFDFDLLRGALIKAQESHTPITDDCSAVEALGMSVYLTDGSDENIKITTPTDLVLAQAIWEGRKRI